MSKAKQNTREFANRHARNSKVQKTPAERKKITGASRAERKNKREMTGWIRKVFRISLVAAVFTGVGFAIYTLDLQKKWENFYQKPIKQVQIDGEFLYLAYPEVEQKLRLALNQNFFDIDLQAIRNSVEQNPWVDVVTVAKKWPDKLVVKVVEQQPIARWGQGGFLNMRGDIIRVTDNQKLQSLPLLSGEDQYATEVMQQYLRLGKALAQAEMTLESVELDNTRAWTLTVDGNKIIKLGRDQIWERLQYLTAAKKTVLAKRFDQVAGVDLRYHNGLSVQWTQPLQQPTVAQN